MDTTTETMKLNDGTVLKVIPCVGLEFILKEDMTVEELEDILNKENLSHVEFSNIYGAIYGKYDNLNLTVISKYVQQDYLMFYLEEN